MASSLNKYHEKRHFRVTSEPAGKVARRKGWSYLIQKHDASHLHYDFRLELDGVLKSWAVPKGPSLDPANKRLAVEVEDHPVEYGKFEGTIPEGQYGGGTVLLWDHGTWEPIGDPHAGLKEGKLKFQLHGEKLRGGWMLVRSRYRPYAVKPQWLLIKERDDNAQAETQGDILEEQPLSIVSGRDLDEIAKAKGRVWNSKQTSKISKKASTTKRAAKAIKKPSSKPAHTSTRKSTTATASISGAKKKTMPRVVNVQLATLTKEPPQGDDWLHEIKFDGYRMICHIDGNKLRLVSRNQQDWTNRMHSVVEALQTLPAHQAILEGEVVALKSDGTSDFQLLQNAFREGRTTQLHYYVFDLLYLDGQSLTELPLEVRKQHLATLLLGHSESLIHYSDHVVGSGERFMKQACKAHLEGIICKRRDQPYHSGRGYDWLKVKCLHTEEFVIGGYTEPQGARSGFGALLVGFYDDEHKLHLRGQSRNRLRPARPAYS